MTDFEKRVAREAEENGFTLTDEDFAHIKGGDCAFDTAMARKFLDAYFQGVTGYAYVWLKRNHESISLPFKLGDAAAIDGVLSKAAKFNRDRWHVYFGVNVGNSPVDEHHRYKCDEISAQVALPVDIDCDVEGHHKGAEMRPQVSIAKSFLLAGYSFLVESGGGIHAYYKPVTPYLLTDDAQRALAGTRGKSLIDKIRQAAGDFRGSVDNVSDLPRVMRLCGSVNWKSTPPKMCRLIETNALQTNSQLGSVVKIPTSKITAKGKGLFDSVPVKDFVANSPKPAHQPLDLLDSYAADRRQAMFDCIDVSLIGDDNEWLAWMSTALALGFSYEQVDAKNRADSARYNASENLKRWNSITGGTFGEGNLCNLAKRYGNWDEASFKHRWREAHAAQIATLFDSSLTDERNAARLIAYAGKTFRYIADASEWIRYVGKVWRRVGEKNSAMYPLARETGVFLKEVAEDDTERRVAVVFESQRRTAHAVEALKSFSQVLIEESDLDQYPRLLNCQNGIVDLETGKLYPHNAARLLTQQARAEYQQGYRDQTVDKFLADILPDEHTRDCVLNFLGYSLTGDTFLQQALFASGTGANGKSTLFETVMYLLGNYATTLPKQALLARFQNTNADAATTNLNKLKGKRLSVTEEMHNSTLAVSTFKQLSGGGIIHARKLHQEAEDFQNSAKLVILGNGRPRLSDPSELSLQRRLLCVDFTQTFTGENCDASLPEKLRTPSALAGLLSLLVEHCRDVLNNSVSFESDEMKASKAGYLKDEDTVGRFIDDFVSVDSASTVTMKALLEAIREECGNEVSGKSDRKLREEITRRLEKLDGVKGKRAKGGMAFGGCRLEEFRA